MTATTTPLRRTAVLLTLGIAATGVLAACSASAPSASTADRGAPAAAPAQDNAENLKAAPPGAVPAQGGAAQAGAPGGKPNLPAATGQRSIVYTGSITVRVDNVTAKAAQLTSLTIGTGGLIGGDERQMDNGKSTATLTLRVPADKFTATLNDIGKLGTEQTRKVSTQDVTATVIDVAARIQSQQASVDRVRALLARAQSIADITSIESELARRESDLEALQAQQRNLSDLTALSTIAVTLLGPDAAEPPKPKPAETGFLAGLKNGWKAFAASVNVVLTVLGALLPFIVLIGVPVWLVLVWLRRRRAAQVPPPAPLSSAMAAPKTESER
jgi:hypothetical protein